MKAKHKKNLKLNYKYFGLEESVSWISIESRGKIIAEVKGQHYGVNNNVCDANAKLFAAAPDLLGALIKIKKLYGDRTDYINEYKQAWNEVEIAITKATK